MHGFMGLCLVVIKSESHCELGRHECCLGTGYKSMYKTKGQAIGTPVYGIC